MDFFITLEEAASLEGVKSNTLWKKIYRSPDAYKTEQRPNPNGGKPLCFISLSSLSQQAQRKYKAKNMVAECKAKVSDTEPWYLNTDYNWYKTNYPEYLSKALSIYEDMEKYSNKALNMTVGQFESFMAEKYSKDMHTIRRYLKDYYEASAWAYNKELETGESYDYLKILAVGRKPRVRNVGV